MYITNRPEIAQIAESAGVDRIFVDMEYIGKEKRQNGLDTVMSRHSFEDIKKNSELCFFIRNFGEDKPDSRRL